MATCGRQRGWRVRTERSLLQRFAQARPLTWLLAGLCSWALLLWIGALLGMGGRVAAVEPLPAGALPQPRPATPDRIGPLVQYAEAAARPLFTQDRRPRGFLASVPEGDAVLAERLAKLRRHVPLHRPHLDQDDGGYDCDRSGADRGDKDNLVSSADRHSIP